jgi:hypothetical protein
MKGPVRFPNLFIVGAMKSGTSSLHAYLQQHPQIFMSRFKEPQYFAPHRVPHGMWGQGHSLPEPGIDWYLRLFAEAGDVQYAGEASVSYTARHWVSGCEERIWQFNPAARIIYLMRDPVERAISHYWHFVAAGRETLPPERALRERDDYVARSDYAWQIEPYLARFGEGQVYLLTLEELEADPRRTFARLFAWLGVDDAVEIDTSTRHNVRVGAVKQTRRLAQPLVRMLQSWRWRRLRSQVPRAIEQMLEAAAYHVVDSSKCDYGQVREYLWSRLAPRVQALAQLTGREYPEWGAAPRALRQSQAAGYSAQIDNKY